MVVDRKDSGTEAGILRAAREIFTCKGRDGARMQEIADRAGVNKTLLHYYFRSKEQLFRRVVGEAIEELVSSVIAGSFTPAPFKAFLRRFIDRHIDFLHEHREMLGFLLWEFRRDPELVRTVVLERFRQCGGTPYDLLAGRIRQGVRDGEIRSVQVQDVVVNLAGLNVFVFAVLPIVAPLAGMGAAQEQALVRRRKKEVFRLLWNDLAPERHPEKGVPA